jgi:hypothetical protein
MLPVRVLFLHRAASHRKPTPDGEHSYEGRSSKNYTKAAGPSAFFVRSQRFRVGGVSRRYRRQFDIVIRCPLKSS